MSPLLLIAGIGLVVLIITDALWTILWADGRSGPITRLHATALAKTLMKIRGRNVTMLSLIGPIVLFATMLAWVLLLWSGWLLVFSASPDSLRHAHSGIQADLIDRAYVVGGALSTLGGGGYEPTASGWKLAVSLAGLSGFFLVGLIATYILSLFSAVVQKRSFASQVMAVGYTPEDFVINCWNGTSFSGVELQVLSLTEQLNLLTERHQAYPLLHYFHSRGQNQSVPRAVAVFDEALSLMTQAVVPEHQPAPAVSHAARESVRMFIDTGRGAFIKAADYEPARPRLDRLGKAGIPLLPDDSIAPAFEVLVERRRVLLGFVENDHGDWPSAGHGQA